MRWASTRRGCGSSEENGGRRWRDRVEPLLTTFEQLHGHRNVPRDLVVPSDPPWHEKDWGIQLGKLERKKSPQAAQPF